MLAKDEVDQCRAAEGVRRRTGVNCSTVFEHAQPQPQTSSKTRPNKRRRR